MKVPSLKINLGRSAIKAVVGLDIQPGHVAAVQARVNGKVVAERAAALPLPADTMREGEVLDEDALAETLRELFAQTGLPKEVRFGVANQRAVLRTLELPPVTDTKELEAAVRFQAQEQIPMPLGNATLDFNALGVHDTPDGERQQVVLVAAQRDMVSKLLSAVRSAGLRPEGVDLSAFALIRSLYRADAEHQGRVLYLNVDGLTNMAIAEGRICRFTRVVGGGLEAMAGSLAERLTMPVVDARDQVFAADMTSAPDEESVSEVRSVLDAGIREIAGEVRNSLDFHRSQEGGGEVDRVVLSGAALDVAGFADALQAELGVNIVRETVGLGEGAGQDTDSVSPQRLAIAAGLAVQEGPK
jgi:type IV pilus assembly protein PilM